MQMQNVLAESEKVDIRLHRVIYKAIEEIEAAMKGMLILNMKKKLLVKLKLRTNI